MKQLQTLIRGSEKPKGKGIGWFEDAQYEDGTPVAYVAALTNSEAQPTKIPPRSFMRSALEKQADWKKYWRREAARAVTDNLRQPGIRPYSGS